MSKICYFSIESIKKLDKPISTIYCFSGQIWKFDILILKRIHMKLLNYKKWCKVCLWAVDCVTRNLYILKNKFNFLAYINNNIWLHICTLCTWVLKLQFIIDFRLFIWKFVNYRRLAKGWQKASYIPVRMTKTDRMDMSQETSGQKYCH